MELTEKIESLNRQLVDLYGINTTTGHPMWRIVWSEDQFEKRLVNETDEGLILLTPIVKEVPKYRSYIKERYILERLVIIPDLQQRELPTMKLSYEPMWTFEDARGNYLPPRLDASKLIIDTVYAAQGKESLAKYIDPDKDNPVEKKAERVGKLEEELFGNETVISDALAHGMGIVVPQSYDTKKES
jgi:hypothetical protein